MTLSVFDANTQIKNTLYDKFKQITINGIVQNIKISNGNNYFNLKNKDDSEYCVINCVIWNRNINFRNDDELIVSGNITVFVKSGTYQLQIKDFNKIVNNDENIFEKNKKICIELGYFNNKKILPQQFLKNIGIITSLTGAALFDMLCTFKKNNYKGNIKIKNCFVQGSNCVDSVINGIKYFQNIGVDIIIITRGGGSKSDLNEYNSIELCKYISSCPIYTISGIGHEIDNVLIDYAVDYRCPTPTACSEYVCELQNNFIRMDNNVINNCKNIIENSINYSIKELLNIKQMIRIDTKKILINCKNILSNNLNQSFVKLQYIKNNLSYVRKLIDNKQNIVVEKLKNIISNNIDNKLKIIYNVKHTLNHYNINNNIQNMYCIITNEQGKILTQNEIENANTFNIMIGNNIVKINKTLMK